MPVTVADAPRAVPLPVVDGLRLPAGRRDLLRPGAIVRAADGARHRLPRFFYEVESWALALETPLSPHFAVWEFLDVDVHEAAPLREFPRYVPCAVSLLAAALETVRLEVNAPIRVAANGGYRSPSHARSGVPSPHCWAAAANIFSIGDDALDAEERIARHASTVRRLLPAAWIRPFGDGEGTVNDQLHVDVGYATLVPRGVSEEEA